MKMQCRGDKVRRRRSGKNIERTWNVDSQNCPKQIAESGVLLRGIGDGLIHQVRLATNTERVHNEEQVVSVSVMSVLAQSCREDCTGTMQKSYLSQLRIGGTRPVRLKTKYEYRTTSVALQASSIVE
jgi:hypothetical protein